MACSRCYPSVMSLESRVALISGATGALGRALARRLAGDGASLVLVGTDAARLEDVVSSESLPADRCLTLVADLRSDDDTRAAVQHSIERFGRIDVLAHLVGGYAGGTPLVETDAPQLRNMLDQHAWTTFNAVRAVVPLMTAAGWGRIIAVSPTTVATPGTNAAAYTAAKAAQDAMLVSLARELKGTGVTANLVVVRAIDADRSGKAGWATPEHIASTIVYLCSDDAATVNGARIPLTG
jgi:NAD(P)-dependent dehydrogenase (short-subunit alcohol dehydrogenase family)